MPGSTLDRKFDHVSFSPRGAEVSLSSEDIGRNALTSCKSADKSHDLLKDFPTAWREERSVAPTSTASGGRARVAIYTRYSTRNQYESSTERQIESCGIYAEKLGFEVVENGIYSDEERSGGYMFNRDRLTALIDRAASGELDGVVIEDASRLSRDMVDLGWLWRLLKRRNIQLHATTRGIMGAVDIAVYGFLNQEQRQTILANTAWGRRKMVQEGRAPWGKQYGYRRIPGQTGSLEPHREQAPVVSRIFKLCAEGITRTQIARLLNAEGEPGLSGRRWTFSAVAQLTSNPLYRGILIYGRQHHGIDPDSGKRFQKRRPESEWQVTSVPELAIVDADIWNKVQTIGKMPQCAQKPRRGPRSQFLLSGLIHCCVCGSHLVSSGTLKSTQKRRLFCSAFVKDRSCANGRSWYMSWIDTCFLNILCGALDQPDLHRSYLEAVNVEANDAFRASSTKRSSLENRIAKLRLRMMGTFDEALTRGMSSTSTILLRQNIERDLSKCEKELSELPARMPVIDIESEIERIGSLTLALRELAAMPSLDTTTEQGLRLMAAIRAMIDRVILRPMLKARGFEVELTLRSALPALANNTSPQLSLPTFKGTYTPIPVEDQRRNRGRLEVLQLMEAGTCVLDDATWRQIDCLVPDTACRYMDGVRRERRDLVEMMLLTARLRRPFADLPCEFGSRRHVEKTIRHVNYTGVWISVFNALNIVSPAEVRDLNVNRFSGWGRRKKVVPRDVDSVTLASSALAS